MNKMLFSSLVAITYSFDGKIAGITCAISLFFNFIGIFVASNCKRSEGCLLAFMLLWITSVLLLVLIALRLHFHDTFGSPIIGDICISLILIPLLFIIFA